MKLDTNYFYPVLFVSENGDVKKIINSQAPYSNIRDAINHAYMADYPASYVEAGYAGWSGKRWIATPAEVYYEAQMQENEEFDHPQNALHAAADRRLEMEAMGQW